MLQSCHQNSVKYLHSHPALVQFPPFTRLRSLFYSALRLAYHAPPTGHPSAPLDSVISLLHLPRISLWWNHEILCATVVALVIVQHTILNLVKEGATPSVVHKHQCVSVLDRPQVVPPSAPALRCPLVAAQAGAADACLEAIYGGHGCAVAVLRRRLEGKAPQQARQPLS